MTDSPCPPLVIRRRSGWQGPHLGRPRMTSRSWSQVRGGKGERSESRSAGRRALPKALARHRPYAPDRRPPSSISRGQAEPHHVSERRNSHGGEAGPGTYALPNASGSGRVLECHERFMRRMVSERKVRFYKIGKLLRFDVVDLEALAKEHTVGVDDGLADRGVAVISGLVVTSRRHFGSLRQRDSGRWQIRYWTREVGGFPIRPRSLDALTRRGCWSELERQAADWWCAGSGARQQDHVWVYTRSVGWSSILGCGHGTVEVYGSMLRAICCRGLGPCRWVGSTRRRFANGGRRCWQSGVSRRRWWRRATGFYGRS